MESDQVEVPVVEFLNAGGADSYSRNEHGGGWVFWRQQPSSPGVADNNPSAIQHKFLSVLNQFVYFFGLGPYFLAQFWVPKEIDGKSNLTTADQPFAVRGGLYKGLCSYREKCVGHNYFVGEGAKEEELGPIGRVFRNGHPECSPDLRLYCTREYSLRDVAARSDSTAYVVLPVLDLRLNMCGVLEMLSGCEIPNYVDFDLFGGALEALEALEAAGLRSTHTAYGSLHESPKYEPPVLTEIQKMLKVAVNAVPQMHLAQVSVPCRQCASTSNNLCCMERVAFTNNTSDFNSVAIIEFLQASIFQLVQGEKGIAGIVLSSLDKKYFCRNICDLSISRYPLAHFARLAGLSFSFAIFLQSLNDLNDVYVVEFFLQTHNREDAYPSSILKLLLQIMRKELKSFKVAPSGQLGEELIVEVRAQKMLVSSELAKTNMSTLGYETIPYVIEEEHQSSKEFTMISRMEGYHEIISVTALKECLHQGDSLFEDTNGSGIVVYSSGEGEELKPSPSSSALIQEKIKFLLWQIMSKYKCEIHDCLVQFWAVKRIENKFCLMTSDQPFALARPCKGLCEYRIRCIDHHYFVNEGARGDELGPPGRVFLTNTLESNSNLRCYSTEEFPLRDFAVHCGLQTYLALPILYQDSCVGVLEFISLSKLEFLILDVAEVFNKALQGANLKSTHTFVHPPQFNGLHQQSALHDIRGMLDLVVGCSQLFLAKVWVPCNQCPHSSNNWICSGVKTSARLKSKLVSPKVTGRSYEEKSGKKGIFALLLASKNKSCFCLNLCDFSITEEPHAVFARDARLDVYFAICLQRSDTRNELYILEFFLEPGCRKHEHLCSFLYFLLLKMKERLKSFRVASGKQIGEELVVEVITLGKNNEFTSFGWHLLDEFPIRFEIIQYDTEKEDEHGENNVVCAGLDFSENAASVENENISTASVEQGISIERSKTSFHLTREDIEPHFGTNQSDAAKELGVSRSTLKRACRELGISRWPSKMENKKNPRLFDKSEANKRARILKGQIQISTSGSASPSDLPPHQNVPLMNAESNQPPTEFTQADTVTIKAKYNDETIKFPFCISAGMSKLVEDVGSRLNFKARSFKLKYIDEDDDEVLLVKDVDLQLCWKTMKELGKPYIQLLVQLIP